MQYTKNYKDALISMSGGLDSTCLAFYMISLGYRLKIYSFKYGQKHAIELKKLKKNIAFIKKRFPGRIISHSEIDLTHIFNESCSSLSKFSTENIPEGNYNRQNMISTVVENRNIIFASIIYGKALSWNKTSGNKTVISLGTHTGDHTIYPDCTEKSRRAAEKAFRVSNWGSENIRYISPFNKTDKGGVLSAGLKAMQKLGLSAKEIEKILSNCHTCYNPDIKGNPCNVCGSCKERAEAFAVNNIKDPALKTQKHTNPK